MELFMGGALDLPRNQRARDSLPHIVLNARLGGGVASLLLRQRVPVRSVHHPGLGPNLRAAGRAGSPFWELMGGGVFIQLCPVGWDRRLRT